MTYMLSQLNSNNNNLIINDFAITATQEIKNTVGGAHDYVAQLTVSTFHFKNIHIQIIDRRLKTI